MKITSLFLLLAAAASFAQSAPSTSPASASLKGENGLRTVILKKGTGETLPTAEDFVRLNYTVWNAAGVIVGGTGKYPELRNFAVASLFPELRNTIETMRVGEKQRVWIPAELSPENAPLVFEVELLEITRPMQTPTDLQAPPLDARKSRSGLAWKVLRPGDGSWKNPGRKSWVSLHLSGWTTDGVMFDNTYSYSRPRLLQLSQAIPGFSEGVRMMTVGEKRRFWIPANLVQRDALGTPSILPPGMLIFDIELMAFRKRESDFVATYESELRRVMRDVTNK